MESLKSDYNLIENQRNALSSQLIILHQEFKERNESYQRFELSRKLVDLHSDFNELTDKLNIIKLRIQKKLNAHPINKPNLTAAEIMATET